MNEQLRAFLNCLFEPNEATCFSDTPKGTQIFWRGLPRPKDAFFSINPLDSTQDRKPTESWHHQTRPRRCDDNVVLYRNILCEIDNLPLEEQKARISNVGLPYSTCVYSGGKSYHFIISLKEPLTNRKDYDKLVNRVYRAVGDVDRSCKNPSRLSRLPGHHRLDSGKVQELIFVGERIENQKLEDWLMEKGIVEGPAWEEIPRVGKADKDWSSLSGSTKHFLAHGSETDWNISLFKAAADLCRTGFSEEEAFIECTAITGTLDKNDEKTIRSAYRNENNK